MEWVVSSQYDPEVEQEKKVEAPFFLITKLVSEWLAEAQCMNKFRNCVSLGCIQARDVAVPLQPDIQ
jgi:hypothetical protein